MSVFDGTMVNLTASGATPASTPPPEAGNPPPSDGSQPPAKDGASQPAPAQRPEASDFIGSLLDKHGLTSADELSEFIDNLANVRNTIGDEDPEELIKAKETLARYQREWAKKERDALREKEAPEETIARLEKELQDEQTRQNRSEAKNRKAESAKQAIRTYNEVVSATAKSDTTIPDEYMPFLNDFMGVDSPVNGVNILDRAAVKKLTREYGIGRLKAFEQLVIKRYRDGKAEIPPVPPNSGGQPPVTTETKPKNMTESRRLAHTVFARLLGGR